MGSDLMTYAVILFLVLIFVCMMILIFAPPESVCKASCTADCKANIPISLSEEDKETWLNDCYKVCYSECVRRLDR